MNLLAEAQTTAFNFQGRLNDGAGAASGAYDFQFKLFDAIAGGNQVGATLDRANLQLVNGVFSTTLDFGAVFSGSRFLEIAVRPAGSPNAFVILGARQQILAVPAAIQATNAINAVNAQTANTAAQATNSLSLGGVSAAGYARLNFANQGDVSAVNMSTTGFLSVQGNAVQPGSSNGFPKVMLAVTADGSIARCYNGITGATGGNCGGISIFAGSGAFTITFPFPVTDRFWLVTNHRLPSMTGNDVVTTAVIPASTAENNKLVVYTQLNGSGQTLPFHLFVF